MNVSPLFSFSIPVKRLGRTFRTEVRLTLSKLKEIKTFTMGGDLPKQIAIHRPRFKKNKGGDSKAFKGLRLVTRSP